MFWIYGGGYQEGGTSTNTDGTADVGTLKEPWIIVTVNYRLNVFGFAAADALRLRDPSGGTGNYGILDQRMGMEWVQTNIHRFGGDPSRVFITGQSAGGDAVSNHVVRAKSWGLFSAAGMESGAYYRLTPPSPNIQTCGPTPGNFTVADQSNRWAGMMKRLGCSSADDVSCAVTADASLLYKVGSSTSHGNPEQPDCGWSPTIDGVDLTEPVAVLASKGKVAKVPVIAGSTMEDGAIVFPNCNPADCNETDFKTWAKFGYGLSAPQADKLAAIYADEKVRNVTAGGKHVVGTKWYWAQVHAGSDVESTCPARRAVKWATQAGQKGFWYYWEYSPKDPGTGQPGEAAHCAELKFLWSLRCNSSWTGGKPWAKAQCRFGFRFASFWQSFAARSDPAVLGPAAWPAYVDGNRESNSTVHLDGSSSGGGGGGGGGERAALVINDAMEFETVFNLRGSRCDYWDSLFPRG